MSSICQNESLAAENDEVDDFSLILIPAFSDILTSEMPERIRTLRFSYLNRLYAGLNQCKKLGYMQKLLCAIARKKSQMILNASTKAELEKIVHPPVPHYNGSGFVSDEHLLPEEELICWSQASLRAPLNQAGFKRYMELFREVLPEESKKII